jgi:hypothetical protein
MEFPFTVEEFLNVFKSYNESIFPFQIIFYLIAFFSISLIFKQYEINSKIISAFLSFFWLWIGIVYHLLFFTSINKAAYFFGGLFIMQSVLFGIYGIMKGSITFEYQHNIYNYIGIIFIVYAIIIYPILGYSFGHNTLIYRHSGCRAELQSSHLGYYCL